MRSDAFDVSQGMMDAERALRAWARKARRWLREGRAVHVYFDNDAEGAAPRNAERLIALLEDASG